MSKMTSEQAKPQRGGNRNPNGKGGFKKGESGNPGGRPRNIQRYDYWIQFFKDMSVTEFKQYAKTRKEDDMYVAEVQAMQ